MSIYTKNIDILNKQNFVRRDLQFVLILLFILCTSSNMLAQQTDCLVQFDLSSKNYINIFPWKHNSGDNPEWNRADFNDESWEAVNRSNFKQKSPGLHWYRTNILFSGTQDEYDVPAIRIFNLPAAYEVYWDGILIGTNGKIGSDESTETPGETFCHIKLKREYTQPGNHILAIRLSNFSGSPESVRFDIYMSYSTDLELGIREMPNNNLIYIGIYFSAFIFCLALFFSSNRNRSFLILAVYCLMQFAVFKTDNILQLDNVNISIYHRLEFLFFSGRNFSGIILNIFFLSLFDIHKKHIHTGIMIMLFVTDLAEVGVFELLNFNTCMLVYSAILIVYSVYKKKVGSTSALIGVVIILFGSFYFYFYNTFDNLLSPKIISTYSRGLFISCLIVSVSMKIRQQNRLLENLKLRSKRLETEMLKKSIQPHFIMNTLLSIRSYFQKSPQTAEKLIDSLAEEFKLVNQIAEKIDIPLEDEIKLVRNHLELMGYRRDAEYDLIIKGDYSDLKVPPMILHTLIENGITHSFKPKENGKYFLFIEDNSNYTCYRLQNNGSQLAKNINKDNDDKKDGTGMKYIKARLEESYPGKSKISYGIKDDLWEVEIRILK